MGRPKSEHEARIDADAERLLVEYEASDKTIAQLAEEQGMHRSKALRMVQRARRVRTKYQAKDDAWTIQHLRDRLHTMAKTVHELRRMLVYCNACSSAPGEECASTCTRDGYRDRAVMVTPIDELLSQ